MAAREPVVVGTPSPQPIIQRQSTQVFEVLAKKLHRLESRGQGFIHDFLLDQGGREGHVRDSL